MDAIIHNDQGPAVSILLPFEPMMMLRKELRLKLRHAVETAENEMTGNYPDHEVRAVMDHLHRLLEGLNYNTDRKSIALFASVSYSNIIYLNFTVHEQVVVDRSFQIRDVVYQKKELMQYLVLTLSTTSARIFLGNDGHFLRLRMELPDNGHEPGERVSHFSDPDELKEKKMHKLLHKTDDALAEIFKIYDLPLFVLGTERVLGHFKAITSMEKHVSAFIHGNYDEAADAELYQAVRPHIEDRKHWEQMNIMRQMDLAMGAGRLVYGIKEVWNEAMHKNGRILIVEKDLHYPAMPGRSTGTIHPYDASINAAFYIKDAVDDIIEQVLTNGGDVAFTDNDMLKEYGGIALIEYHK